MRPPLALDTPEPEVHLWTVRLQAPDDVFARCLSWLSRDEIARAERFYFEQHRRTFVLGRGVLRAILASYLRTEATELQFSYGPHGKPALSDASCPLRFNASHSGDLAAYAFTAGCEIGVDVEEHRPMRDLERIARRFFSPEEAAEVLALSEVEKTAGFYNCWTRKEAYVKAVGGGLSIPLSSFRVSLCPGAPAQMLSIEASDDAARGWTVHDFTAAVNSAGAVAYADTARPLRWFQLESADELLRRISE